MAITSGEVIRHRRPETSTGQFGVIVFLASDVMLFAPFFAAYFLLRSTNSPWPPEGADIDLPRALVFTIVLASSSALYIVMWCCVCNVAERNGMQHFYAGARGC